MDLHCVLQRYVLYCMFTLFSLFILSIGLDYLSSYISRLDTGHPGLRSLAYDIAGNLEFRIPSY